MTSFDRRGIRRAACVFYVADLDLNLEFFLDQLGFRLEAILPADAPTAAILCGHGMRVELRLADRDEPGMLRLWCDESAGLSVARTPLSSPSGVRIETVDANAAVVVPEMRSSFVLSRLEEASWGAGRAGLLYRDLIPDRQGGRFIASHIRVPKGGPVPDYVHFHKIRFQMIYCFKGWCRLVYEDQGPVFTMRAGDCVLQPPEIRHRVLECSDGFEVVEIGCPAVHETFADHGLELPTNALVPERQFGDQRYVFHRCADAEWQPFRLPGFSHRDSGIGTATGGLASAQVARLQESSSPSSDGISWQHAAEFVFLFVLAGKSMFEREGHDAVQLSEGDSLALPSGPVFRLFESEPSFEFLEVSLPSAFETRLRP